MIREFLIKVVAATWLPFSLCAHLTEPCPEAQAGNYEESHYEDRSPALQDIDQLDRDKKSVYYKLGPVYQKIFLYALNDEQKHRVVMYVHRGIDPYEAVDVILRTEQRKHMRAIGKEKLSPAEKSISPGKRSEILDNFEE